MTRNNFNQAMYQAELLYGISFTNPDDFAEIALNAWSIIGNKETRLYKFFGTVDCETLSLELPCNCDIIEAVLEWGEDFNTSSNIINGPDMESHFIEEYIEHRLGPTHELYESGHYVNYHRVGDTLYFKEPHHVLVLYKGIVLDEEDLPYINDKEMNAIATYVAYIKKFKEALMTNNQAAMQMAQMLEKKWYIQCDQARTSEYLTQNEANGILNAKNRWCGRVYGTSFKPLRK